VPLQRPSRREGTSLAHGGAGRSHAEPWESQPTDAAAPEGRHEKLHRAENPGMAFRQPERDFTSVAVLRRVSERIEIRPAH